MTLHWIGFSGSINTKINEVTDDPEKVTCILCQKWMELNKHEDA